MRYLLLASLLLLTSCSVFKPGTKQEQTQEIHVILQSLSGTAWALDSIINYKPETKLTEKVTLVFNDTTENVYGMSGCNYYNGKYHQDKSSLKFSHLLSTKKYCVVGSKTETMFTSVLLRCNQAALDNKGHLLLKKDGNLLAIFSKTTINKE